MILTTTELIEGKNITSYLGMVCGTDIYLVGGLLGGGLANQENLFSMAMANARAHLENRASAMGADAVVGIQTSFTSPGTTGHMILALTGTAVKLEDSGAAKAKTLAGRYEEAEELMRLEKYDEAEEAFFRLGDFRDSAVMTQRARQLGLEQRERLRAEAEERNRRAEEERARNGSRKNQNWVCPKCGKENVWFITTCSCGTNRL